MSHAVSFEDERPPEVSCHPAPRPCPPWYLIHRTVVDINDLVGHKSYHVATAIAHAWRAGMKPGSDAAEDLRQGADHLLLEAARLEKLNSRVRR